MRVMITGCNGLLGQNLVRNLVKNAEVQGVDLHATSYNQRKDYMYQQLDITNRDKVKENVLTFKPDWIINTAAFTDVDACEDEREKCWRVNVEAVENLLYAARKANAKVLQLSTDYVFDGKNAPYTEDSTPNPISYYAKSKLASENIIHREGEQHVIVRTAVLYGVGKNIALNFVLWLINELEAEKPVKIVDDQISNTTYAMELATGIWKIIEKNRNGIYHICGNEIISRFDFALLVAEIFNLNRYHIKRIKSTDLNQKAQRPENSGLVVDKALQELDVTLSDAKEGILKLRKEIRSIKLKINWPFKQEK